MEYDNTDRGAAFPPRQNQKLIYQGSGQFGEKEVKLVFISDISQNSVPYTEVYQKVGVIFKNKYKEPTDNKPHFTGKIESVEKEIACWKTTKQDTGMEYLQWKIKEPQEKDLSSIDDDIPFGKELDRMAKEQEEESKNDSTKITW